MKKLLPFIIILAAFSQSQAQNLFPISNQRWVDSVFATLTIDEKIGQLMMPRGNVNVNYDPQTMLRWVNEYHVGGFVLFAGYPNRQAAFVNSLQAASKVPMFIGMDLEWGLNMRLDSTVRFPYAMTLGAIQGHYDLLERMGEQVAAQCKRMGVHINYAPVADINNNPNNPVINFRSYGENKYDVTEKAYAYMKGMQTGGLLTSIKHFPGHGDTGVDSHFDVPLIPFSRTRLDTMELYPFRELIKRGAKGVMVAHLSIPALDTTQHLASTLSHNIVTDLLRKELGFKGLTFTDAMDMQGAVKYFPEGMANVKALLAGNDILETFVDVPAAFNAIKKALTNGEITEVDINERVKRILTAKVYAGLDHYKPIETNNLITDLNPQNSDLLNRQLADLSATVIKNEQNLIPFRALDTLRIATLSIGSDKLTPFQKMASNYTDVTHFNLLPTSPDSVVQSVKAALKNYNLVLVCTNGLSIRPAANYQITPQYKAMLKDFLAEGNTVLNVFANVYSLNKLEGVEKARSILMSYQDTPYSQETAAKVLFGAIAAQGKLPVSVNENYAYGLGFQTSSLGRFNYTVAEEAGINSQFLTQKIDSLVGVALSQKAIPGCQVLVAKAGKVIFQKAYGFQTYEGKQPVKMTDVYDLASVTKISTSLAALMKWKDEGKFSLDMTLGDLMPEWKNSNKANLNYKDILTHQARLKAWIPFWMDCIDSVKMVASSAVFKEKYAAQYGASFWEKLFAKKKYRQRLTAAIQSNKNLWKDCVNLVNTPTIWKDKTFANRESEQYPMQVADNLWIHKDYHNTIMDAIRDSPLREKKEYVYSDLSYYIYPQIAQRMTGMDWESYLKKNFYAPLGATTLTYNAKKHFPMARIVPTEYDSLFRKNLIHGRVHDEGAAMLDGISGHAGLFGNANDLAKLMQMYLQMGTFGGKRYIQEATLKEWTSYPFPTEVNSRRGIGFDKPDRKRAGISAAVSASAVSFGHSGFTGTYTWIDPAQDLVYVFLSNRVYPTRNNSKISDLNTRTNINEAIYEAIRRGR